MFSALHIPDFPLAVLLRERPELQSRPVALASSLDQGRRAPTLLALNELAGLYDIQVGFSVTRALARCPDLHLLTPDADLNHAAQGEFLDFALSLTPDLEISAPGTLLLDAFTIPLCQIDPRTWISRALEQGTTLGLPLHLSLAPTPDLAHLAARSTTTSSTLTVHPRPSCQLHDPDETMAALRDLPLATIAALTTAAIPAPPCDLLHLWGLQTLGDLADLPRQGLAERLGPDSAHLHDLLHGKHHRLLTLHRPSLRFHVTHDLEDPLESLEPLLFLLHRALDTLCARLSAAQRAAQTLHLSLTFDDLSTHQRELRLPEPSCQSAVLLRPLHTHLDSLAAPAPVVSYALHITPTRPREAQHHLFQRTLRDPNQFADTLARLQALLGPDRVGTPQPLDSHRPDSFRLHPFNPGRQLGPSSPAPFLLSRGTRGLPLQRFRPPLPVNVASESRGSHPHPLALLSGPHQGAITQAHGPYLLSGQWWHQEQRWQRAEWDIQLPDQTLLRLTHLPPQHWQLEGHYG